MAKYIDVNTLMGVVNDNDLVTDEGAIVNSLVNIMMIPKRSRKFRPQAGGSAYEFLQRPISELTALQMRDALLQDIKRMQPLVKVTVKDIRVTINSTYTGYDLSISYTSKLTGTSNRADFNLFTTQN